MSLSDMITKDLVVITGRASDVRMGSDVQVMQNAPGGPALVKTQIVSLRVDNKPVLFRTKTVPSISDGDQVAVAGSDQAGTMQALALRNLTTGADYSLNPKRMILIAWVVAIISIPLIAACGIGLFFIGVCAWLLYQSLRLQRAAEMVARVGVAPA